MSETWQTLIAVAVGGSIPIVGKIMSDWLMLKWGATKENRDRRRQEIYELQDAIYPTAKAHWDHIRSIQQQRDLTKEQPFDDYDLRMETSLQMFNITKLLARVSDPELSDHLENFMKIMPELPREALADDRKTFDTNFEEAGRELAAAGNRIVVLLDRL